MLILLSNLNLVTRIEVANVSKDDQDVTDGGLLQGMWVTPGGAKFGPATVSGEQMPGKAFQIWTESNRSIEAAFEAAVDRGTYANTALTNLGAGHFSPDAADKAQLTALYGKYRALTNMWIGADPSPGDALYISDNGFLTKDAAYQENDAYIPFAVVTAAKSDTVHIGKTYSCIEYVTL